MTLHKRTLFQSFRYSTSEKQTIVGLILTLVILESVDLSITEYYWLNAVIDLIYNDVLNTLANWQQPFF